MSTESVRELMIDEASNQISEKNSIIVTKKPYKTAWVVASVTFAVAFALGASTSYKEQDVHPLIAKYLDSSPEEVFNIWVENAEPGLMDLILQLKLEACYTDNLKLAKRDTKALNTHLANVFAMISFLSSPNRDNFEEFEEIKRLLIESRENAGITFTTQFECRSTSI